MKKYFSVFALAARASFTKVIAITMAVAILCSALLWIAPEREPVEYPEGAVYYDNRINALSPDYMIMKSFCVIPVFVGFLLIIFLLMRIGTGKGVKTEYFVKRLRIRPRMVTVLWSFYNFIMILFYRASIAFAVYAVIGYRIKNVGPQALLLASYGNKFMHQLLPLRDIISWFMLFASSIIIAVWCAIEHKNFKEDMDETDK